MCMSIKVHIGIYAQCEPSISKSWSASQGLVEGASRDCKKAMYSSSDLDNQYGKASRGSQHALLDCGIPAVNFLLLQWQLLIRCKLDHGL